jgi:hypothetical protein
VNPAPEVSVEQLTNTLCASTFPFIIIGLPTSENGSFSSNSPEGVVDNGDGTAIVDPSLIPPGVLFTINYTYTNENGCESSASTELEVNALPDAGFTELAVTYFANDPVVLITPNEVGGVFSTSGPVVLIDNGDGSVILDPTQTPIGGLYTIIYTITGPNGCTNEQIHEFSIVAFTAVGFNGLLPTYCEGDETVNLVGFPADENGAFSATVPDGALIDNGDGTAVLTLARLEINTVFEVTYTYDRDGQLVDSTLSFQVLPSPLIDLPEMLTICGETTIFVGPGNEDNSVLWSTGATTPELMISEEGTYTVQVITPDECVAEISVEISLQPGIELLSNFLVADQACVGESLQFIDVSSVLEGVISYYWEFGDDNTSTAQDPIHAYSADGTFEVTLTAEVDGCNVIIVSKPVTITNCRQGPGGSVFDQISVFPNPNRGNFQIEVNLRVPEVVKITVFDVYGKTITTRNGRARSSYSYSFADLKAGTYFVNVQSYGQQRIKRMVVID